MSFRFSGVLSALSFALDLVGGRQEGHTVRSCLIGMKVADRLGLDADQRSALFYALLLKDAGCSGDAPAGGEAHDGPAVGGWRASRELVRVRCGRGAEISRLMGLPEETARAIRSLDEHWDGGGRPDGLEGEEIPLLARVCGLSQTVEVFFSAHGPAEAEEAARVRSGRWFDPALVESLLAEADGEDLWAGLSGGDPRRVSDLEPEDGVLDATPERVDLVARAFGEISDAKSPFTRRHSEGVARVAALMGGRAGLEPGENRDLMRASLLHDIGKLGIPGSILDKPERLTDEERARIQEHPGLTREILSRVGPFRPIAETAANHHEKLDGSGYPRGLTAEDLDLPSRILTVADIYDALRATRPYHDPFPKEKALEMMRRDSGTRLCPEAVAILEELAKEDAL